MSGAAGQMRVGTDETGELGTHAPDKLSSATPSLGKLIAGGASPAEGLL